MRPSRSICCVVLFASSAVDPARAWAEPHAHAEGPPAVEVCVAAYESGQRERLAGRLRAARASFLTCSQESCPRVARVDCAAWLSEVERLAPSLVFSVKGPDGTDLAGALLTVDGGQVERLAEGRSLVVDPGTHLVRISAPGFVAREQRLVVVEGEKARLVRFDFETIGPRSAVRGDEPKPSSASPSPAPSTPRNAWLMPAAFALSATALAGFAGAGLWGLVGKSDLEACKPTCSHAAIARIETRFVLADVFLVVGLFSGGFATYRALTPNTASPAAVRGLTIGIDRSARDESSLRFGGRF